MWTTEKESNFRTGTVRRYGTIMKKMAFIAGSKKESLTVFRAVQLAFVPGKLLRPAFG